MSSIETKRVHRYPCDGVRRFGIKGNAYRQARTYQEAYDDLFTSTGCTQDDKGLRSFTAEGALRIAYLNAQYTRLAGKFLTQQMLASMKARIAKKPETAT